MPFCITCGAAVADDDGFCSSCGATTQERTTAVPSDVSQPPLRDTQWHYSTRGERLGPVSEAQIVELIGQRTITEESLVWDSTMADWCRFSKGRDPGLSKPFPLGVCSSDRGCSVPQAGGRRLVDRAVMVRSSVFSLPDTTRMRGGNVGSSRVGARGFQGPVEIAL